MIAHHETYRLSESNPDLENKHEDEYQPEKLEGVDKAAAGALNVIEEAIKGERHVGVSDTERGLRGIVDAPVPGGYVIGLFDNAQLDQIEITLDGESGDGHTVRIDKPESGSPVIYLDGVPAIAEDMPSIVTVIEQINTEREAIQQNRE